MAKFSFKEELEKAKENKFDDGIDGKKILCTGSMIQVRLL